MRLITRLSISVLSSVLVLLGFSACKTTQKLPNPKKKNVTYIRDTIHIIKKIQPEPWVHKVVYAAPPAKFNEKTSN